MEVFPIGVVNLVLPKYVALQIYNATIHVGANTVRAPHWAYDIVCLSYTYI